MPFARKRGRERDEMGVPPFYMSMCNFQRQTSALLRQIKANKILPFSYIVNSKKAWPLNVGGGNNRHRRAVRIYTVYTDSLTQRVKINIQFKK